MATQSFKFQAGNVDPVSLQLVNLPLSVSTSRGLVTITRTAQIALTITGDTNLTDLQTAPEIIVCNGTPSGDFKLRLDVQNKPTYIVNNTGHTCQVITVDDATGVSIATTKSAAVTVFGAVGASSVKRLTADV